MIFNDAIGAFVSAVAVMMGWSALLVVIGVGFWKSAMWSVRQARWLMATARREWRESTAEEIR